VRDEVREAGFGKPRIEGEENGEWIIVDCGSVVVHIMQPSIRQYYHLEEIWGEKPVRLKLGADKPKAVVKKEPEPEPPKKAAKKTSAKTAANKSAPPSRPRAAKPASKTAAASPKPLAKSAIKHSAKPPVKKVTVNKPAAKKSPRKPSKA
jgi:ribosome-associated protein